MSPEEPRQDIAAKLELHWKSLGGSCSSLHRDNCKNGRDAIINETEKNYSSSTNVLEFLTL